MENSTSDGPRRLEATTMGAGFQKAIALPLSSAAVWPPGPAVAEFSFLALQLWKAHF